MNKRHFFRKTASISASVALIIGASAVLTTSYAASSEAEEHAPTMKPISTIPVSGIQVPQTEGIDHVEIAYKSTGEMGLEALNREGREFTLTNPHNRASATIPEDCSRCNFYIVVVAVPSMF